MENNIFTQFFSMIALVALIVSTVGFVIFFKTAFFCIKRYVVTLMTRSTAISSAIFKSCVNTTELDAHDLVEKNELKELISIVADDTENIVRKYNFFPNELENLPYDEYVKEINALRSIYSSLSKMEIKTREDLEEVKFLFNNGRLQHESDIESFYKEREERRINEKYRNGGFIDDCLKNYEESQISTRLILSFSAMIISGFYIVCKLVGIENVIDITWEPADVPLFIWSVIKSVFDFDHMAWIDYDGEILSFCLCLIISVIVACVVGGLAYLISEWISDINLGQIYRNAGLKKKPNIHLGVNTAAYVYMIHRLLKRK